MKFFRVQIFCPTGMREDFNRELNRAWRDEGQNMSVPLSSSGRFPAMYYGASGALNDAMISALREIVGRYAGTCAFVSDDMGREVDETFGFELTDAARSATDFDKCADLLGQRRIFDVEALEPERDAYSLLLQTIVTPLARVPDGQIIEAISIPWLAIVKELERDPNFLHHFAQHHRAFEEFLAASYDRAGFSVTLTPQRGDRGRDVIAERKGVVSVRILDQAKAYSPGHLVTHDDVRAMLGTLATDSNSSKGVITTTSDFQPGIHAGDEFKRFMPYRLELKNGVQLRDWLARIRSDALA